MSVAGPPAPVERFAGITKEIAEYFFTLGVGAEIRMRLSAKHDEAKQQSREIVIASLSLGTVVCFDVLKQFADRYKISIGFTTGTPIAKSRRVGMYGDNLGAIMPQNIARWHNIYDTTDWIADPLESTFSNPGYRPHDIFVNVASDPVASHDYFNNRETIQMFADALR